MICTAKSRTKIIPRSIKKTTMGTQANIYQALEFFFLKQILFFPVHINSRASIESYYYDESKSTIDIHAHAYTMWKFKELARWSKRK